MSKDLKAVVIGLAACVAVATICVGLPWAARHAQHPLSPDAQPLRYIGDEPPPSS